MRGVNIATISVAVFTSSINHGNRKVDPYFLDTGSIMRYTKQTLIADLNTLGADDFQWNEQHEGTSISANLAVKAARERSGGSRTDIAQIKADAVAECCWVAYEKALYCTGDMVIGRFRGLLQGSSGFNVSLHSRKVV